MRRRALEGIASAESRGDPTSLIDVTFLLLVFFLCTLEFKKLEGKLEAFLPEDEGGGTTRAEPSEPLTIRITVVAPGVRVAPRDPARAPSEREWAGSGRFELAGRRLAYGVGARTTASLPELRGWLEGLRSADPERALALDAGPGTLHGDVVPVLDAAVLAGFSSVRFVAERPAAGR